jgi:hypothetical protein
MNHRSGHATTTECFSPNRTTTWRTFSENIRFQILDLVNTKLDCILSSIQEPEERVHGFYSQWQHLCHDLGFVSTYKRAGNWNMSKEFYS